MRSGILSLILLLFSFISQAQCSITSTNGWTVNVAIQPISVVPEFTNCPNYYHYELKYKYTITFSGSTSNRSFSANIYFTCTGGTGGTIYQSLGTFNSNTTGTLTTNNNARQYSAISTNNYGSNPNCNQVTLANVNCTSVRIDYWGNNTVGSTINCSLSSGLPVELIGFGAFLSGKNVEVAWSTASEKNSKNFTIEKSLDGVNFEEAGKIDAAGNSYELKNYSFIDKTPFKGISYYRLKQTDTDNSFKYFNPVSIDLSSGELSVDAVYPNPAGDFIQFHVNTPTEDQTEISVLDITGKVIYKETRLLDSGNTNLQLNLKDLENGIYFLKVNLANHPLYSISKFVKQN